MDFSKLDLAKVQTIPAFGLGRFAPFCYERSAYESRIRLVPIWFAVWTAIFLIALWFVCAAGLYGFIKYSRGFEKVRYADVLLLPVKKENYERSKAEYYLEIGREALAEKKYGEAFHFLRIGLAGVPQDTEARRVVVELYLAIRRPDLARELVLDGVAFTAGNVDYLQWVFSCLLRLHEDDTAVELAREFLRAMPNASPNARHAIAMAEAAAHFFRGRLEDAEATLRRENSLITQDGLLLLAKIEVERGEAEGALRFLRTAGEMFPGAPEPYQELVAELWRQGKDDDARRTIVERMLAHPDDFIPYLDALEAAHRGRNELGWKEQEARFWAQFGANVEALDQLALRVSRLGRFEAAKRIWEERKAQGGSLTTATTALAEALLAAGRADAALTVIQDHETEDPEAKRGDLTGLKIIAYAAMGNKASAQRTLLGYLERSFLRPDLLAVLAQRLISLSSGDLAEQVWDRGFEIDPDHSGLLTQRLNYSLLADDWEKTMPLIRRFLTTRKPSRELCRALAEQLSADRYLLLPQRADALVALFERATPSEARQ